MTGNLAVANEGDPSQDFGNMIIYRKARGKPKVYDVPNGSGFVFCTYDNKGNLFANDFVHLYKLIRRGVALQIMTIADNPLKQPRALQWVGQNLTIADWGSSTVYRFKVTGLNATLLGNTSLKGWNSNRSGVQSWIYQGAFIAPTAPKAAKVGIWNYPEGGSRIATLGVNGRNTVFGVTISVGAR